MKKSEEFRLKALLLHGEMVKSITEELERMQCDIIELKRDILYEYVDDQFSNCIKSVTHYGVIVQKAFVFLQMENDEEMIPYSKLDFDTLACILEEIESGRVIKENTMDF